MKVYDGEYTLGMFLIMAIAINKYPHRKNRYLISFHDKNDVDEEKTLKVEFNGKGICRIIN